MAEASPAVQVEANKKGAYRGRITISLYQNGWNTEFDGHILGRDVDQAMRYMMKGYRVWKASQIKKEA